MSIGAVHLMLSSIGALGLPDFDMCILVFATSADHHTGIESKPLSFIVHVRLMYFPSLNHHRKMTNFSLNHHRNNYQSGYCY